MTAPAEERARAWDLDHPAECPDIPGERASCDRQRRAYLAGDTAGYVRGLEAVRLLAATRCDGCKNRAHAELADRGDDVEYWWHGEMQCRAQMYRHAIRALLDEVAT